MARSRMKRLSLTAALLMLVSISLYRLTCVLYSYAATNVLYAETALPSVLEYVRGVFFASFVGALIAAVVTSEYLRLRAGVRLCAVATVLLALDAAAALIIDLATGAVYDASALVAALNLLADLVYNAGILWLCLLLAVRLSRRGTEEGKTLLICCALFFLGRLIPKAVSVVSFLIEVEFSPYTREVLLLIGDCLQLFVLYAGAVWLLGTLYAACYRRLLRNPPRRAD